MKRNFEEGNKLLHNEQAKLKMVEEELNLLRNTIKDVDHSKCEKEQNKLEEIIRQKNNELVEIRDQMENADLLLNRNEQIAKNVLVITMRLNAISKMRGKECLDMTN